VASIVAVVADLHVNSKMGLAPPIFELDGGGAVSNNKTREWIWNCWLDYWGKVKEAKEHLGADVYAVFNGDLVDVNTHSGYGLISPNENDLLKNTMTTLQPALEVADYKFVVRGTEAHAGGASWLEEQLARLIGAERDVETGDWSWHWLQMVVGGVNLGFAHHPATNSTRPWTHGAAAIRMAQMIKEEYFSSPELCPRLVTYGHFHHDEDSFDNSNPVRVIYLPSWTGMTGYDSRCGRAHQIPKIGGNLIYVSDERYTVKKFRYVPKRRSAWVPE